jgi:hypothetical protein
MWDLEMFPIGPLVSGVLGSIFDFADTSGC